MAILDDYPKEINWLTVQELWNDPVNKKGTTFRIRIGLQKSKKGHLHFVVSTQDYHDGKYWPIAKFDNDNVLIPFGRWFTLRTEIKEGNSETGQISLAVKENNEKEMKSLYDETTQTMASVFCTGNFDPHGFTSLHLMKLYTSSQLTKWMHNRGLPLEMYFTNWKFSGVTY